MSRSGLKGDHLLDLLVVVVLLPAGPWAWSGLVWSSLVYIYPYSLGTRVVQYHYSTIIVSSDWSVVCVYFRFQEE